MTFLAPGFMYAAMAVSAAIAALHFLVTRQPRAAVLPTARFVPNLPATATSRAARPSDLLLLLLRALIVLAAGAALAGPVLTPPRQREARIILVDMSASVGEVGQIRDSVSALYRDGDVLIAFDSSARTIAGSVRDTLASFTLSPARGNLSAALVSAIRTGSDLRERADSVELVIISPFTVEEWDAATDSIRTLWPGSVRIIRAGGPTDTPAQRRVEMILRAGPGDPLNATMSIVGSDRSSEVRLVRDELTAADTEWASGTERVVVAWPVATRPPGAISIGGRQGNDTGSNANGVVAGRLVVIAKFERRWKFPADSLTGAAVIARWIDGEPAAIERPLGAGCTRSVAIPVAEAGDLAIRPEFILFVSTLTTPCRRAMRSLPAAASSLASLAGTGGPAPRDEFSSPADVRSSLAPWLFALSLAAVMAELLLRGRHQGDSRKSRQRTFGNMLDPKS